MPECNQKAPLLKPYYFYYLSWSRLVPVITFDCARVQKGDQ